MAGIVRCLALLPDGGPGDNGPVNRRSSSSPTRGSPRSTSSARTRCSRPHRVPTTSRSPRPSRTRCRTAHDGRGPTILADRSLRSLRGPIDTLVVVGGEQRHGRRARRRARRARSARAAARSRRVASVCTGAFLLAAAGRARRPARDHALAGVRATSRAGIPRDRRPGSDLRARRRRVDVRRRDRGHGPRARARHRRPRPRRRAARRRASS